MPTNVTPVTDELFTATNIVGVGVATGAVLVVANALYVLAGLPRKTTAFVAALAVAYLAVAISSEPPWFQWVLAFFNACLLYCSALGANEMGAGVSPVVNKGVAPPGGTGPRAEGPRTFFGSWMGKAS